MILVRPKLWVTALVRFHQGLLARVTESAMGERSARQTAIPQEWAGESRAHRYSGRQKGKRGTRKPRIRQVGRLLGGQSYGNARSSGFASDTHRARSPAAPTTVGAIGLACER